MTAVLAEPKAPETLVPAPPRPHLPGLDGVRGIAVLLVLAYHAVPERLPGGFVGVDVFFVLSGFLITGLLLREKEETGTVRLRRFWVRRVRRLVPALVVMLTVVSAATLMVGHETGSGLRSQVVGALTWTSNWIQVHQGWSYSDQHLPPLLNHLWSLGIEEQFYLLWPLLLVAALVVLKRRASLYAVSLLALASIALMAFWYRGGDATRAYMGLDSHAFGLLLGAALALSAAPHLVGGSSAPADPAAAGASRRRTLLGVVGLAGVVAFAVLVTWNSDVTFLGGLGLASVASVALIHAAANPGPVAAVLGCAPLRWLGERSYGLYLWHWPLIVFAVRLAPPAEAEVVGCLAAAVAVVMAAVSYRWVEVPMCRDGIGVTLRRWGAALQGRGAGGVRRSRVVAAATAFTAVLAAAAVWQAPAESDVENLLRVGQEVVIDSADDIESAPEPVPDPAPSAPPRACQPVAEGSPVTAFGDSVTVAIAPVLMGRRPGSVAVATVGWQYGDVAAALRQVAAAGQLQPTVVIATGTNGTIDTADLDRLVSQELAGRQVALVTPSVPGRSWSDQAVAAVQQVAAAHDNVRLVDWNGLAVQHPELTASDRVHPNAHGQNVYNDLLSQALVSC